MVADAGSRRATSVTLGGSALRLGAAATVRARAGRGLLLVARAVGAGAAPLPPRLRLPAVLRRGREARLEGGHQVRHLLRLLGRLEHDLLAFGFLLDQVEHGLAVGVVVLLGDELLDVDRPRLLGIEALELLVADDHVLVGADLVALHDVVPGDLLAVGGAHPLLLDADAVRLVELVKAHRLLGDCAVELDRDVHQPEADGAGPDGPRHGPYLPASASKPSSATAKLREEAASRPDYRTGWRLTPSGVAST